MATANLDRERDFAQVIGMPGVAYEQDGKQFRSDGTQVQEEAPARKRSSSTKPVDTVAADVTVVVEPMPPLADGSEDDGFPELPGSVE